MKTWQDRGEVQDSDDEELSLGAESQSPEHIRKKQRLVVVEEFGSQQKNEAYRDVGELQEDDSQEEAWLRPAVVASYSSKNPLKLGLDRNKTRSRDTLQASSHHGQDDGEVQNAIQLQQSHSEESESLPDVDEILAREDALDGTNEDDDESSAPSSPLSEREVSPPTGFEFPSLGQATAASFTSGYGVVVSSSHEGIGIDAAVATDATAGQSGRRSLRARTEKQLHPYLLDQMQYQKQCRARGMRPIRYVEEAQTAAETQDATLSGDESESERISHSSTSSAARPSSELGGDAGQTVSRSISTADQHAGMPGLSSDDELPDMQALLQRPIAGGVQSGVKRRKLAHVQISANQVTAQQPGNSHLERQDSLSIPPSPPPTSSDSTAPQNAGNGPAGFRMPRGLSPAPLPTPQISSDVLDRPHSPDSNPSDPGLPRRISRPSTVSRPRPTLIDISSESESSEADSERDVDETRLLRERKRIRGVLPASWLKIDLRQQRKQVSPSPERRRTISSSPPASTAPLKGVAQRVISTRPWSLGRADVVSISDDDESDAGVGLPESPKASHSRGQSDQLYDTIAQTDVVEEYQMEVDWVDPMLAGSSRKHTSGRGPKRRQPRITDVFDAARARQGGLLQKRYSTTTSADATSDSAATKSKRTAKRAPRTRPAVRLSIVDAPRETNEPAKPVPQFVRLAMRRARRHSDHGRHSPTRKHIRLATKDDTEDATATLQAWREGTIAPHSRPTPRVDIGCMDLTAEGPDDEVFEHYNEVRAPLQEIHRNRQQKMPRPIEQAPTNKHRTTKPTSIVRRPRVRQTRLQPVAIEKQTSPPPSPYEQTSASATSRQRQRVRSQPQPARYRGAQLESLENDFDREHRAAAFERRMHDLTRNLPDPLPQQHATAPGLPLQRFLRDPDALSIRSGAQPVLQRTINGESRNGPNMTASLPHRPRKRPPQRLDVEAREYRQPSEPLPEIASLDDVVEPVIAAAGPVLQGLGQFGTRYATDFDVLPLALGTYFHASSFVGSGDFAASLNFAGRDLARPAGRIRIHLEGDVLELGAWTEDVAVSLSRTPTAVSAALQSLASDEENHEDEEISATVYANVDYLLRSTVRYLSRCVYFLDPVDRRHCVSSVNRLVEDLLELAGNDKMKAASSQQIRICCIQYAVVIAHQAHKLSNHALIQPGEKTRSSELMTSAANRLAGILPEALPSLRSFYEDNKRSSKRETGIKDGDTAICSVVILHHTLGDAFWSAVNHAVQVEVRALNAVGRLDQVWYNVFMFLPALEVNASGVLEHGSRFTCNMREDWSLIRRLVERVFELYPATSGAHSTTINDYVRATLIRCHRLINRWGWWRCESILGTIFDFFARRSLAQLHKEDSRGSPKFLDELDGQPSLEVQVDDRSFHIFLKMLGSGLQGMRNHGNYPDKKIGGIAWRFIPNHGRTYRKDAEIRQEDLDALRNHHDLLCTLYFASPPGHRLRVELVSNLVDHTASHREACRLNVRAWSILTSFQASIEEDAENLLPLNLWFRSVLSTTINQYRHARAEAEQDVATAKAQGVASVAQDIVEDVIVRNQKQITATIVDCLAALKRGMRSSSTLAKVLTLIDGCAFWQVFDLFDPSARRLYAMHDEALEVVKAALDAQRKLQSSIDSQQTSNDSQDYGDSTALQEFASTQRPSETSGGSIVDSLHGPMAQLVSNVFGADVSTDDALLSKIIDLWTYLAQLTIRSGKRTWTSYLSDYSSDAWNQLRDTIQKRKYTPYFLSCVLESDHLDPTETPILTSWLRSLVEREAMLKFQHILTTALLNRHPHERLLQNLPFVRGRTDQFDVSLHELRQRRLALLSSVLSNMRDHFDSTMHEHPHALQGVRRTYADMLRQLMQAMKVNYQEIQTSRNGEVADHQAQGAYVEFVQQVVSFLQQYTMDICRVDSFFTDSSAFPLPAEDPTYVVGRLRSYTPRLAESRKRKELSSFVLTVSERAAVDGQQAYLVEQLIAATDGVLERGNLQHPSLRSVLIAAVFPAYIENALSTACSWIFVGPILQACGRIVRNLLYDVQLSAPESVQTVVGTISTLLHSMSRSIGLALTHAGLLTLPHVQRTLAVVFNTVEQCLTCAHHLQRTSLNAGSLANAVACFAQYGAAIEATFMGSEEVSLPDATSIDLDHHSPWSDTLDFARTQIRNKLNNDWYAHDGQYFVRRGRDNVEVVVELGDEDEEKSRLLQTLRQLRESYEMIFAQGDHTRGPVQDRSGIGGVLV